MNHRGQPPRSPATSCRCPQEADAHRERSDGNRVPQPSPNLHRRSWLTPPSRISCRLLEGSDEAQTGVLHHRLAQHRQHRRRRRENQVRCRSVPSSGPNRGRRCSSVQLLYGKAGPSNEAPVRSVDQQGKLRSFPFSSHCRCTSIVVAPDVSRRSLKSIPKPDPGTTTR